MNTLLLSGPPGRQYGIPHLPGVHSFDCYQARSRRHPGQRRALTSDFHP